MDSLVRQVLGNPSQYPLELTSWIAKKFSGNKLLQIDWPQLPGPKITSGPISAGPPKTPDDGDIWIASNVDTNGVRWAFQYNAGSSSAYKWEFIGGAALYSEVGQASAEATTSTTYTTLTTAGPTLTLARAGDYTVGISMSSRNDTSNDGAVMSYDIGATAADDSWGVFHVDTTNSTITRAANINGLSRTNRHTSLAANTTLTSKYRVATAGQAFFLYRHMWVTPVRVS